MPQDEKLATVLDPRIAILEAIHTISITQNERLPDLTTSFPIILTTLELLVIFPANHDQDH